MHLSFPARPFTYPRPIPLIRHSGRFTVIWLTLSSDWSGWSTGGKPHFFMLRRLVPPPSEQGYVLFGFKMTLGRFYFQFVLHR